MGAKLIYDTVSERDMDLLFANFVTLVDTSKEVIDASKKIH